MADLQSCYFCGAPDDIGEYAVVPPRLGGGDRSVVLCADCKTKLLRVMEPLIERAEAGGDGGEAATESTAPSAADTSEDAAPETDGVTMSSGGSPADSSGAGNGIGDGEESTDSAVSAATEDADSPPSYRRAMRMLSNRPFPIQRTEAESMLANAYDLEREEIDAVLEHAQREGRLLVEDGEIREP